MSNRIGGRLAALANVITFKVPVKDRDTGKVSTAVRSGTIAWLPVGDRKVCFVLQRDDDGKAHALAHYASGMLLGNLNSARIEVMCARGHHARLTPRGAALWLLDRAIRANGVEEVIHQLDKAPRLNAGRL